MPGSWSTSPERLSSSSKVIFFLGGFLTLVPFFTDVAWLVFLEFVSPAGGRGEDGDFGGVLPERERVRGVRGSSGDKCSSSDESLKTSREDLDVVFLLLSSLCRSGETSTPWVLAYSEVFAMEKKLLLDSYHMYLNSMFF